MQHPQTPRQARPCRGAMREGDTHITLPYIVVCLAVVSASSASVVFQYATAEPLVVAFYRLGFSTVLLTAPLLWGQTALPRGRDLQLTLISGVFLALHFATWFFSLKLTSIASSTILVTTHPFLVLLYGYLFRRERTNLQAMLGVLLAIIGTVMVGWGDFLLDTRALLGDLLAFAGAVAITGYLLIGREVRQRVGAMPYSTVAYASATLVLLLLSLGAGSPLAGFAPVNWWVFVALAVFPTLFGHTLFNWALRHVHAAVVSVSFLGEPIGATLLAWLIWRTAPGTLSLVGGAFILLGIGVFIRYHRPA